MAVRCEDEFNPWPSFVDIFSSVILVMLLFLLVLLVNLGYYSQFKYKISYTGSISSDDLILNSNPDSPTESKSESTSVSKLQDEVIKLRRIVEQSVVKAKEKEESEVISGGIDVKDVRDDDNISKQVLIENEEYLLITFKGTEIFLDNEIMKKIKVFIDDAKSKYDAHRILINAYDLKGQVSATVTKQISLARSIGTRNLIRKMGYKKKDVRIDLLSKIEIKEKIDKTNGYLIIRVKK